LSAAGLVPVLSLAERAGLRRLVDEHLTVPTDRDAHAGAKVVALVAGWSPERTPSMTWTSCATAACPGCSPGSSALSTLGSFVGSVAFGHVRQLDAVAARLVANLAAHPPLLPDVGQLAYLDIDDTIRATYGYANKGAGYGYNGVKGLNALLAALSTPSAAPVIVASRLRNGSANRKAALLGPCR
jgi:hypothetical protein